MKKTFEKKCLNIYKSISPCVFETIVPVIDWYRKLKNKPPIPLKEKMAKMDFPKFDKKLIMIHGVSVGEVLSLEKLIHRVKKEFSDYGIVVTTGTLTGQELAKKKYGEIVDFITYFPIDIFECCKTFLEKINPSLVLIAETELWPNFLMAAKEKNIPTYIINGRISDKSYPSYLKIKNFLQLILENFEGIYCQSNIDRKRFIELGSCESKTEVMKNLKFEIDKKESDIDLKQGDSKVLIAGSTHSGEDEIILFTYYRLKCKIKNLKLIIAPRHLTRIEEVKDKIEQYKFSYGLRTMKNDFSANDIIILDTLGELSKIYSIVDVAFIGGSFNSTGGHNPLEATIYAKPTVSGPSIKNFRDIYSILIRHNASFIAKTREDLYDTLLKLLSNEEYYSTISNNCKSCFENQQGALDFVIKKLKEKLN